MTAYQITSMMEGVVQRGTATVVKAVDKPMAGKTGTTNDEQGRLVHGLFARPHWPGSMSATTSRGRSAGAPPAAISRRRSSPTSCRCALATRRPCRSACRPASS